MLFMLFNLVSWLSPTELMQMTRKGKEKAPEPKPTEKKSRIENNEKERNKPLGLCWPKRQAGSRSWWCIEDYREGD
jgi:hypothetical protein